MELPVDAELRALCAEIAEWMRTEPDWVEDESSDMFQSEHYCGGWEGPEDGFTFSHYDATRTERWFSLSPDEVRAAASGALATVDARDPA